MQDLARQYGLLSFNGWEVEDSGGLGAGDQKGASRNHQGCPIATMEQLLADGRHRISSRQSASDPTTKGQYKLIIITVF